MPLAFDPQTDPIIRTAAAHLHLGRCEVVVGRGTSDDSKVEAGIRRVANVLALLSKDSVACQLSGSTLGQRFATYPADLYRPLPPVRLLPGFSDELQGTAIRPDAAEKLIGDPQARAHVAKLYEVFSATVEDKPAFIVRSIDRDEETLRTIALMTADADMGQQVDISVSRSTPPYNVKISSCVELDDARNSVLFAARTAHAKN